MTSSAILCVDDEPIILEGLQEQLQRQFGDRFLYEVAESAHDAWEIMEELDDFGIKIVVIVSDWLMPEVKGDEFLIEVHQRFPNIVTVMLTGQADEAAVQRAKAQANLYACLHKPWTEEDLAQVINSALR